VQKGYLMCKRVFQAIIFELMCKAVKGGFAQIIGKMRYFLCILMILCEDELILYTIK
jgi:hypothetical protein